MPLSELDELRAFDRAARVGFELGYVCGYYDVVQIPVGCTPNLMFTIALGDDDGDDDNPERERRHEALEALMGGAVRDGEYDRVKGHDARYGLDAFLEIAPELNEPEVRLLLSQLPDLGPT